LCQLLLHRPVTPDVDLMASSRALRGAQDAELPGYARPRLYTTEHANWLLSEQMPTCHIEHVSICQGWCENRCQKMCPGVLARANARLYVTRTSLRPNVNTKGDFGIFAFKTFFRATCQPRCQRICKQKCDM
jgi:hypothetical protein